MAAAAAVADEKVLSSSPPPGELSGADLAAAKTLMYLCLASAWVGGASAGAAALSLAFRPAPLFIEFLLASLGADLVSLVFAYAVMLRLLHGALRGVDSRAKFTKSCGPELRRGMIATAMPEYLVAQFLMALNIIGCLLLLMKLSDGSWPGGIVMVIVDVGVVGSAAISCFLVVPGIMLKLWRMKPCGAEAAACIV
ncbi:hypothetical protein QOZ80_8BG0659540 [Eleusine coracana subsp. coracana]|nr:hypothetical protein QOZ80_8BG0659540 [Eleusine coracana subsp. coracana]